MCEICNIEKGELELLMEDRVEVRSGRDTKLDDHILGVFIIEEDDGYYLQSSYFGFSADAMAEVKLPIDYCPFCGRELKHKANREYKWNK